MPLVEQAKTCPTCHRGFLLRFEEGAPVRGRRVLCPRFPDGRTFNRMTGDPRCAGAIDAEAPDDYETFPADGGD